MSKRVHFQRAYLWFRQRGLCHWCKKPTLLVAGMQETDYLKHRDAPKNLATIDHLDSRLNPERGKKAGELRKVVACWQCNNDRGIKEEKALGIEEIRRRANGTPKR